MQIHLAERRLGSPQIQGSNTEQIWCLTFVRNLSTRTSLLLWQVAFFPTDATTFTDQHRDAAYPDGHPESDDSEDVQIDYLKAKVDAGADYIVTQLFYDVDGFLRWEKRVREKGTAYLSSTCDASLIFGTGITVPIVPSIMPIQTYSSFLRVTKLAGTKVPASLMAALVPIRVCDLIRGASTVS